MIGKAWPGLRVCVSALWRDTRGAVLIYVTVGLTVLLGGAALVIDAGRLYTMNSELQAAADAFALACAAELDRSALSEDRALTAIQTLVANKDTYSQNASSGISPQLPPIFLSALPADSAPLSDATVSTDPSETRFCQVSVVAKTMDTYFIRALTGQTSKSTNAVAVAGFDQAVCAFTPLFICNPYEVPGEYASFDAAMADPAFKRRLVKLAILGGPASQPVPGNFGYLESPFGPGAKSLADSLGMGSPPTCFFQNGVSTKTGGTVGPVRSAMNTRFDMYRGPYNAEKSNPQFRPSMNVRRGWVAPPNCMNPSANTTMDPGTTMGLPRDLCFASDPNTCATMGPAEGRMGAGDWDFEMYWATNHCGGDCGGSFPNGWSNGNRPSRYDAYREEIDSTLIADAAVGGETGTPVCYTGGVGTITDVVDRRILYAAVVDCAAELSPGHNTDVITPRQGRDRH